MKKRIGSLLLAIFLFVGLVALPIIGYGDAGDFSGNSDYGSSDWGSSSDWGGSDDWGSSDWRDDDDDDWGGSGWNSNNNNWGNGGNVIVLPGSNTDYDGRDGGLGGGMGLLCLLAAIVIVVVLILNRKKKPAGPLPHGGMPTINNNVNEEQILAPLMEKDPNFSKAAFIEKVGNIYVQMQQAWQAKDWDPMRMHMTDTLFSQMERQLEDYKRNNRTNFVERISVLGVRFVGYSQDAVNDILTCRVNTRIVDYTVDDNTGEVISGSKTAEKFMEYEYTFVRSLGMLTPEVGQEPKTLNCKNCGAPLQVNHSGKCPYCDSIITASEYDWVLFQIKGISQQTVG